MIYIYLQVEYLKSLSEKVKEISSQLKTAESKPRPSNSTGSVEVCSAQGIEMG